MSNNYLIYEWMMEDGKKNFGDLLSRKIIEGILGERVTVAFGEDAEVVAIGSLMEGFLPGKNWFPNAQLIWGTGFMHEGENVELKQTIAAVRGKLTAKRLNFNGPVGDPGLLASKFFSKSDKKNPQIGVLPHFSDKNSAAVQKLLDNPNFVFIDVQQSPERVIKEITSVSAIISSSLHGLIIADSFGIPNFWAPLSKRVGQYKFDDYFSGVSREKEDVLLPEGFNTSLKDLNDRIEKWMPIHDLNEIQNRLIDSLSEGIGKIHKKNPQISEWVMDVDEPVVPIDLKKYNQVKVYTHRQLLKNIKSKKINNLKTSLQIEGFQQISSNLNYSVWRKARRNVINDFNIIVSDGFVEVRKRLAKIKKIYS